jgi:hypothetical protein
MSIGLPAGAVLVAAAVVAAVAGVAAVLVVESTPVVAAGAEIAAVLVVEEARFPVVEAAGAAEARVAVALMLKGAASATKHLEVVDIVLFVSRFPFDLHSELLHYWYPNPTVRSPRMPSPKLESERVQIVISLSALELGLWSLSLRKQSVLELV